MRPKAGPSDSRYGGAAGNDKSHLIRVAAIRPDGWGAGVFNLSEATALIEPDVLFHALVGI